VVWFGSRNAAAEWCGISRSTLDDALFRAFRSLKVNNIGDAMFLIDSGVKSRQDAFDTVEMD
jgi:hypothetical protein